MNKTPNKYLAPCPYLVLALVTFAVYWPVHNYDFVNYDDPDYVSKNPHVQAGITIKSVKWALTTDHSSNWHPLTWLSLMLDTQLFGTNPGGYHLINLLLHIANTLLLFAVFRKMTGALWRSAFIAAIFVLHPLHVESVAWIAERKDVLSTFFWLLTMIAYYHYVISLRISRYLLTLFLFTLGLMAKPMLVTLPFVLLLLDYWPLDRLTSKDKNVSIYHLVFEKTPLFVLSIISCIITFLVQRTAGSVVTIRGLSLKLRIANSLLSYIKYIAKMFWPHRLAVFYPHLAEQIPSWQPIASAVLILAVTFCVIYFAKKYRYLPVGWFWYIGTLVPVIGITQVGEQAMADRYTYIPFIGLFVIIAWGIADLSKKWKYQKYALGISAVIAVTIFSGLTRAQLKHWQNTITLFEHTIKTTRDNYIIHHFLARYLREQGDFEQAVIHDSEALRIEPDYPEAHNNLGIALGGLDNLDEAVKHFNRAIKIKPDFAEAHSNIIVVLGRLGKFDRAIEHFNEAIRLKPDFAEAYVNISVVFDKQGKLDQAIEHLKKALQIDPDLADAHRNLGIAYARKSQLEQAIMHFNHLLEIRPNDAQARQVLKMLQEKLESQSAQ